MGDAQRDFMVAMLIGAAVVIAAAAFIGWLATKAGAPWWVGVFVAVALVLMAWTWGSRYG